MGGEQGIGPHQEWQPIVIELLLDPAAACDCCAREQMGPGASGQVIRYAAIRTENRCHQEALAQEVLAIEDVAGRICGEFEHHRPHDRDTRAGGFAGCTEQVRHQATLEFDEKAQHSDGFLIKQPRDAIRFVAMQATMRGEQAKGRPAFIEIGRGRFLKTTDVVAPETKTRLAQGEATAQGLSHRRVIG